MALCKPVLEACNAGVPGRAALPLPQGSRHWPPLFSFNVAAFVCCTEGLEARRTQVLLPLGLGCIFGQVKKHRAGRKP